MPGAVHSDPVPLHQLLPPKRTPGPSRPLWRQGHWETGAQEGQERPGQGSLLADPRPIRWMKKKGVRLGWEGLGGQGGVALGWPRLLREQATRHRHRYPWYRHQPLVRLIKAQRGASSWGAAGALGGGPGRRETWMLRSACC